MDLLNQAASSRHILGRLLRDARKAKGLSQSALAERVGLAQPKVSSVERGVLNVRVDTLLRLLAALDLELALRRRNPEDPRSAWQDG